ncbi:MAG: hypothetical protein ABIL68_00205 [bacterium]
MKKRIRLSGEPAGNGKYREKPLTDELRNSQRIHFKSMDITRRTFLRYIGSSLPLSYLSCGKPLFRPGKNEYAFLSQWADPPREFSQAPFWFWNDDLSEAEIARQMQDFCDHGVYGFVIHPRVGLPRSIGWMSDKMIAFMRFAIREAVKKNMWVVLYDEGMYPSGSSSGQVVAENPEYRPRGLFAIDLDEVIPDEEKFGFRFNQEKELLLADDQKVVTIVKRKKNDHRIAILDRFIRPNYSLIRGLHFLEDNPERRQNKKEVPEEMPPLADILNPDAMAHFIKLVYERYYDEFGEYFGRTIKAIFTDEPSFFGKRADPGAVPGNASLLTFVNHWLKEDFSPYLPALWYDDEPEAEKSRMKYYRALKARLEETYYHPISAWCRKHRIALTGHPADPDDIGQLRHFQIPGQDIVWRQIEPGKPSALEGAQSTQAKCASSAMIHLGHRQNSNEYCGAYGHNFTFREMKWLANWLIIRGCNLLYPHAFYYSVRGPRIDERPPDVGPNSIWWNQFKSFADATSRLCWLNTDSQHVCQVAIMGLNDFLPWKAAKVCFQNQIDFNYLEARHLWEDAKITAEGIHIAGMLYKAIIVETELPPLARPMVEKLEENGHIILWNNIDQEEDLLRSLESLVRRDVTIMPNNKNIRIRIHTTKKKNILSLLDRLFFPKERSRF